MEKVWDLRERTKAFAVDAIRLGGMILSTETGRIMQRQFVRSATSVAANYRESKLARSKAEFTSKLQIALEEADECTFWLELMQKTDVLKNSLARELRRESNELAAILMTSLKTARGFTTKNSK